MVWLSDFGSNALVRFDPSQQKFEVFSLSSPGQMCANYLAGAAKYGEQSLELINWW